MGKRSRLLLAIRRVLTCSSKENLGIESEKRDVKGKRKRGLRKRHGEGKKFIPLFREPSSIEKILGDAERDNHKIIYKPPSPLEQPETSPIVPFRDASPVAASPRAASPKLASPKVASPKVASPKVASPKVASPRAASPRVASSDVASPRVSPPRIPSFRDTSPRAASPRVTSPKVITKLKDIIYRPEPTLRDQHISATKIQKVYRGYMARRNSRGLKGMVRLQEVVRGQNVKRQMMSATKKMQLFVRVQTQVQSRRTKMLDNPAKQPQTECSNDKEVESTYGKGSQTSEAGTRDDWDDTVITKEERDARMRRKAEAMVNKERAMAIAYPHKFQKAAPVSAQSALMDRLSGGTPWCWNWVDRQLPLSIPSQNQAMKHPHLTPPRPKLDQRPSPRSQSGNSEQQNFDLDSVDAITPKSTRSSITPRGKRAQTPTRFSQEQTSSRTPNSSGTLPTRRFKPRPRGGESPFSMAFRDDDSLRSCPPFSSIPGYMAPTVSANAKMRSTFSPKEGYVGTPPGSECGRRLSFPPSPGSTASSYKWNKGYFQKDQSPRSIDNRSMDSRASLPVGVGRKPFNRFV